MHDVSKIVESRFSNLVGPIGGDEGGPGFRRLTKDRAKYEAMVADTRRRQEEALSEAREKGPPPELAMRRPRRDDDYPKPKRRKK